MQTTFWKELGEFCDNSKIRLTNKCRPLYQKS